MSFFFFFKKRNLKRRWKRAGDNYDVLREEGEGFEETVGRARFRGRVCFPGPSRRPSVHAGLILRALGEFQIWGLLDRSRRNLL